MKKFIKYIPYLIAISFAFLFTYTALSKAMDFKNFQVQLARSPLLSAYAGIISYAMIILELSAVGLLSFAVTRRHGLYASFGLMTAFTLYIWLILNYSDFVPCSCGGILEKMSWNQHLVFNIGSVLLALYGIILMEKERAHGWSRLATSLTIITVLSAGSIVALFLSSEHIMKKANNFTRRFPHHPILEEQSFDLKVNSYYFAGRSGSHIYLGNSSTPFRLLRINDALQKTDTLDLVPETNHKFNNLQYTVQDRMLYAYDGSVPVIYASHTDSLSLPMREISSKEVYFDQLVTLSPSQFMLRVEEKATKKTALATLSLKAAEKVNINSMLLTDKADGGFDADGRLLFDYTFGNAYYLFYYRNQILKLNNALQLVQQMKTIDTIAAANLKVTTLKNGRKKLTEPPLLVNRSMTIHRGVIFNESGLMGRYESRDQWRNNAVVDIYTTSPAEYWGSMYVQHRGKNRMSQMLITDTHFFVLSGNEIVRYRFAQTLTENFINGGSRKPVSE